MADQTTSEAVLEAMVERMKWVNFGMDDGRAHMTLLAIRVSVALDALQEIADRHLNAEPNHPDRFIALEALAALTGGQE